MISNNTFYKNSGNVLYISSSTNNTFVSWNDFIDNNLGETSQAYDAGLNNIFNSNYWNDWTSPDGNNDRFVDNPYNIDGSVSNQDPTPLVTPITTNSFHYLTNPILIHPNGGEILSGNVTITWYPIIDSLAHSVTYTVYLSANGGTIWRLLGTTNMQTFTFNSTSAINGSNYLVKILTTCSEGLMKEDISEAIFSIQNEVTTTSTTTSLPTTTNPTTTLPTTILTTISTTTEPAITVTLSTTTTTELTISGAPATGWMFTLLLLISLAVIITKRHFLKKT
jgi:hypothetical protein